jgi:hypothetical protein
VRLDKLRVDGWNDAAVDLENARRVLVRALMAVPVDGMRSAVGVRVAGSSGEISVTGCAFNKRIADGVVVGSGAPASLPVERMRVDRCIFEDPGCAVRIANARDLVISRATVVNPTRAMYEIAEDAVSVSEVLVEKCLGYWTPGMLARFSPHPDRIPATAVTLADNLWYSRELPEAWDVLGAPFGYQSSGQVTQLDPGIDVQTLKPRNGEAIRYGAFSIASSSACLPHNTPTPVGPHILWLENARKSASHSVTFVGMCGTDWHPSTMAMAPARCAAATSSATGVIVPSTFDIAVNENAFAPANNAGRASRSSSYPGVSGNQRISKPFSAGFFLSG